MVRIINCQVQNLLLFLFKHIHKIVTSYIQIRRMIHSHATSFTLISLSFLLCILWISNLKYIARTYVFSGLAFFILRTCLIFIPSLSLRKSLAVVVAIPVTILIMSVSVIQMGPQDTSLTLYVLALDLLLNIVLFKMTYSESITSPFNRYICTEFSCCKFNHSCSICLNAINLFEDYASLACDHSYHILCIDEWFANQAMSCIAEVKDLEITCPLCRFDPFKLDKTIYDMSNEDDLSTN
jgi:hypothetical protein